MFSIYRQNGTHVPEVSNVSVTKGFGLTQAQCNSGGGNNYSASGQVTLFTTMTTG
jgi:hypothetical protein